MKRAFVIGSFSLGGLMLVLLAFAAMLEADADAKAPLSQAEVCQAARATLFDQLPQPLAWVGNCITGDGQEFTRQFHEWTVRGQVDTPEGRKSWEASVLDMGQKRHLTNVTWIR